jgi:hypothetical protein
VGEEYRSWSFSLCSFLHTPVSLSLCELYKISYIYVNHKEIPLHILEVPNVTSEKNILLLPVSRNKIYFME